MRKTYRMIIEHTGEGDRGKESLTNLFKRIFDRLNDRGFVQDTKGSGNIFHGPEDGEFVFLGPVHVIRERK